MYPPEPVIAHLPPTSIKNPATLFLATKKSRISRSFNQSISMSPLTPLTPIDTPYPRVVPPPRVLPPPRMAAPDKPIPHHTRSRQPISALDASSRVCPSDFLERWALSEVFHPTQTLTVLDPNSGNSLKHFQIWCHPGCLGPTWNTSYENEIGRLCQGIGFSPDKTTQRIKCTDTFNIINYDNIPMYRSKKITYSKVMCTFRPKKQDPNRIHIKTGGNRIKYTGNVGTKNASIDLLKLAINSVL